MIEISWFNKIIIYANALVKLLFEVDMRIINVNIIIIEGLVCLRRIKLNCAWEQIEIYYTLVLIPGTLQEFHEY